jgi:hypothetical protein
MLVILQSITFYVISVITAIITGLYFYFTRNFKFWQKLGIPYVKPTPFVGNIKDCVLLKTSIGEQLQRIYNEHSDKPYVGIFSFDRPSLLIRDLELVKNILVKEIQNFTDSIFFIEETFEPIYGKNLSMLKGQLWRNLRTNLTPVITSHKMKKMFYLVDICSKELADGLEGVIADGKLPQDQFSYIMHRKFKLQKQKNFYGYKTHLNNGKFTVYTYNLYIRIKVLCY